MATIRVAAVNVKMKQEKKRGNLNKSTGLTLIPVTGKDARCAVVQPKVQNVRGVE